MELLRRLDRELYLELLTQLLSTLHKADSLGCGMEVLSTMHSGLAEVRGLSNIPVCTR